MSSGRYYFLEIVGNDRLSYVAQLSKSTLGDGEKIIEIFQNNNNILYGKSPSQISFLMKQNNQSIFDPSPNSLDVGNPQKDSVIKAGEVTSTPIKRYPSLPRKHLSADDTKNDASESERITLRQRRIFSLDDSDAAMEKQTVDETDIGAEVLVSLTPSESIGSLDGGNNDHSCFMPNLDEIAAADQTFIRTEERKSVHNLTAGDKESYYSTTEMHGNLNTDDCQSEIPLKVNIIPDIFEANAENTDNSGQTAENRDDDNTTIQDTGECGVESMKIHYSITNEMQTPIPVQHVNISRDNGVKLDIQVSASPDVTAGIIDQDVDIKRTDDLFRGDYKIQKDLHDLAESLENTNLVVDETHTRIPVRSEKITCDIVAKSEVKVSRSSDEIVGIAVNPDKGNKMVDVSLRDNCIIKQGPYEFHEEMSKNPILTSDEGLTLSPVKQVRITCAVKSEVQVSSSPAKNVGRAVFRGNKENKSPIGKTKSIAIFEERRKSPFQRTNTLPLRGIPRMVRSHGVDEFYVSLSCESEESPSPKNSRIPLRTCRFRKKTEKEAGDNSPAKDGLQSDASYESKVEKVPKIILRRTYSPSGDEFYSCHNITETSSPAGDKSYIRRKTISSYARTSKSMSPISHQHLTSGSEKDSISSETFLKPKSPQADEDYTLKNSKLPSTKISPKVSKYPLSSSEKMSPKNSSESLTEKNSPTEDRSIIPLKTISPPSEPSKSIILPKADEHRISPSEKTSIKSPYSSTKRESSRTNIDYTTRKHISPSCKISPNISKCQYSPSNKKSCINTPEGEREKSILSTDKGCITPENISPSTKHPESLISTIAYEHSISPLEKISSNSPNSSLKQESPKTNIDYTSRKRISPSSKTSPTIFKFSPPDKMSCFNIPKSVTETSLLTGDCISRKRTSPSTRLSLSPITPKGHEHRISHIEKISVDSPNSSCKRECPKASIDYTSRKSSAEISSKISKCKLSPSDKSPCLNTSEGETETDIITGDKSCVIRKRISPVTKDSESLISPEARENRISSMEKRVSDYFRTYSSKQESPKPKIGYTLRKRKSPSSEISQEISKCQFNPSDKTPGNTISESESGSSRLCKVKSCFPIPIIPSLSSLKTETSLEDQIDVSDSTVLHWFRKKLTNLISMRDECMNEIFRSFSELQRDLNFLFFYVKKIAYVVEKFPTKEEECNKEQLNNLTTDLKAKAHNLIEKYNLWKTAGDSEVQVWIQCFEEIRNIISRNETCKPCREEYVTFLQAYENDLNSIWKKMDDMHIQEEARRSLLQNTTRDFEKFMKLFIKCLIIIGVIKRRSETSP